MVVSVHANMQSEANADKSKAIVHNDAFSGEKLDLKIQLSEILQSSLEISVLLKLFLDTVSSVVKLDGIFYINEAYGINCPVAKQATHSCGYRLITNQDNLGEVIFKRSRKFTEKELSILETLLSCLVFPLRNALNFYSAVNAAFTDPLTGMHNKEFLLSCLEREIELAKRHNASLSVLLVNVDSCHKKQRQKQENVDSILASVAQGIAKSSRTTDMVFRYTSEQFLLVLNNTDKAGTQVIARRITDESRALHSHKPAHTGQDNAQTPSLSFGMAILTGTDSCNSLLERAVKTLETTRKRGAI